MWHVVSAYAGERSSYIELNWPFFGVLLPKLHHYFVKLSSWLCSLHFTVNKFRSNKNKYGMLMSTNNKNVSGIGKGKWRMLVRGGRIFQIWIKIQLIYNPTYISLPINLLTPQICTFQFFNKHTPSYQPSNLYPEPLKCWTLTM
jgi:hypothetical protein